MILFGAGAALGWWARTGYERREKKRKTDQAWENMKAGWGPEYARERYWDPELTRISMDYMSESLDAALRPPCLAPHVPRGPGKIPYLCSEPKGHPGMHSWELSPPPWAGRADNQAVCYAEYLPGPGRPSEFCHLAKGHEGAHEYEQARPPREV